MPPAPTEAHAAIATPSPWIERFAPLIPREARVLDVASGHGRHARFFAARGNPVVAVDRDAGALAALAGVPGVQARIVDLEPGGRVLGDERFDAILVVNYLHRPLLADLLDALADDGVLLYETFAQGNEAFGRPRNPDFLLAPDELLQRIGGRLTIVAFEQGHVATPAPGVVIQRLAAVGAGRGWPPPLPL